MDSRKRALDYLRSHHVMSLATQGSEGIWAAAVFYVNDDFDMFFLSSPTSRHARNIKTNPLVAATVQEDYADWREIKGVQIKGRATIIEGVERATAIARFGLKFPVVGNMTETPREILSALSLVSWYKLHAVKVCFTDNSLGFGHRDELRP